MRWRQITRAAALGVAVAWVVGPGLALAAPYPGRRSTVRGADVVAALAAGRGITPSAEFVPESKAEMAAIKNVEK